MIAPEAALIGDMLSATSTEVPSLAQPHGFVLLDGFAPTDPADDVVDFAQPVRRHDQRDVPADGFCRGVAEQALGGRTPAGDQAVERLGDDGVVGGFHGGREQALAPGMVLARGLGAQMLDHLALQRDRLGVDLVHHARKGARQHAGLAAGVDG